MIKLCLACFGAYGNYMCFGSTSGAPYTNKSCTLSTLGATYIRPQRAPLSFPFSGLFMLSLAPCCNREWNEQPQQGLGELERISARTTHQTVALGQILSALYERSRRGRVTSLTRLASPLLCLTICVAAQPNPTQPNLVQLLFPFSFSCADIFILLLKLLRAHYLRGRNVVLIVWWLHA